MSEPRGKGDVRTWTLRLSALAVGAAIVGLGWKVAGPLATGAVASESAEAAPRLPGFDLTPWRTFPVQEGGRVKPFETFAIETVRAVTGRTKYRGMDPVAVALMWTLRDGSDPQSDRIDWDDEAFILCDHRGLRRAIYRDAAGSGGLTEEQESGKFVSPADLRASAGFQELLRQAQAIRTKDREKAQHYLSPEQSKAEEVAKRLVLFESLGLNRPAGSPMPAGSDPLHVVALDGAPGAGWFAIGQLRAFAEDPEAWTREIESRALESPQHYLGPDARRTLESFQRRLAAGEAEGAVAALDARARERADSVAGRYVELRAKQDEEAVQALIYGEVIGSPAEERELMQRVGSGGGSPDAAAAAIRSMVLDKQEAALAGLKQRVRSAIATGYRPDDPQFRMLHLDYLEAASGGTAPASAWQPYPASEAGEVLAAFESARAAFAGEDASAFDRASAAFFRRVAEVGRAHGSEADAGRIALESRFNRVQPFRWAWIAMLTASVLLAAAIITGSRAAYGVGMASFVASMGFQGFGFYARVAISGRAPVSNMYESIIFVGAMSAVFALLLEAIDRRKVVALAGALVSTLALVLADQLPLVFDPKISPLVPVLRSNYWLVVHVLTIVSSYAGGAVAWALGNLTLGLIVFGKPGRETIKTLSRLTYRAVQIAVLLLAAGTFLGGWWAAESWGRFWGWDPKEVWALIALVAYVIPLHARYLGWVKDFGLAASAVVCFATIVMSWYGVNYVLGAGLHSYGFGGGGPWWVFLAGLVNLEFVLIACLRAGRAPEAVGTTPPEPQRASARGPHFVVARGSVAADGSGA